MNRTIIIVWSWKSKGLGEGRWTVAGKTHAGDQVYCRDMLASPQSLATLRSLIAECQQTGQVMVFLHRQHAYHTQHVDELLQARRASQSLRCFLFGEGTGPIYLTHNARGLLGTSGTFSARLTKENQEVSLTSIADADRRELKPNHFDFVWRRYGVALYERTAELKEDFFAEISQVAGTPAHFEPGELYGLLRQPEHRQLLLRVLSFLGRIRKNSDLAEELLTFERTDCRTLTFENFSAQLTGQEQAAALAAYQSLANYMVQHVLRKGDPLRLSYLRDLFDNLLTALKEQD